LTGLVIDAYFSATKIEWMLEHVGGLRDRDCCFGTIDAWLAFKLTGRAVTDYSNASRTLLFDIHELGWDRELCELFGVDPGRLPELAGSAGPCGETLPEALFGASVPLAGIAGARQAARFGQACPVPGPGQDTD